VSNFEDMINHPSLQREFSRFRSLGGQIRIDNNKIVLYSMIIPEDITELFAQRIRRLDVENLLEVVVEI